MRRTDLMDTSEWANGFIVSKLREMTPSERIRIAKERTLLGLKLVRIARELEGATRRFERKTADG